MKLTTSQKSFRKAIFLFAALIVVLLFVNNFIKTSSMPKTGQTVHVLMKNSKITIFNDEEKDPIKNKVAGLWTCSSGQKPLVPCLKVNDRFELKRNGIFWRVKKNIISLPHGDSTQFVHIMTGYMNPYSKSKTNSDSMAFEVHIIGQVMIWDNDTCYGASKVDTVWDAVADGKRFILDDIAYQVYDTSSLALTDFFPPKIIKLVSDINVRECRDRVSLEVFAKKSIKKSMSTMSVASRTASDASKLIDTYYKGFACLPLLKKFVQNKFTMAIPMLQKLVQEKYYMSISFDLTSQGTVANAKVEQAKPKNLKLEQALEAEVNTWIFPKCTSQTEPLKIKYDFNY